MNPEQFKAWLDANPDKQGTEEYAIVQKAYEEALRMTQPQEELPQVDPGQLKAWLDANQDKKGTEEYATVERAYAEAMKTAAPAQGGEFSFIEMFKNVPASAEQFGKDIAAAFSNPRETAKNLGNLILGIGQKLVPGEQPEEIYADAAWKMLTDRYGSKRAFLNTLQHDPVGTLADISTVLTLGGSAVAKLPGMASKVGRTVATAGKLADPLAVATNAVRAPFVAAKKAGTPRRLYLGAAKFTNSAANKVRRGKETILEAKHRMAQAAMDEGITPNLKGLVKVRDAIVGLDEKIGQLVEKHKGELIPISAVFKEYRRYRDKLTHSALAPQELRAFANVTKDALNYLRETYGDKIPADELQKFKVGNYKRIKWDAEPGMETARNVALKMMANGAKQALVEKIPELGPLNKRYNELMDLRTMMEAPGSRLANRSFFGARTLSGGVIGGSTTGEPMGALLGAGLLSMLRPELMSRTAILMNRAGNWWVPSSDWATLLRQATYQAGNLPALENVYPQ